YLWRELLLRPQVELPDYERPDEPVEAAGQVAEKVRLILADWLGRGSGRLPAGATLETLEATLRERPVAVDRWCIRTDRPPTPAPSEARELPGLTARLAAEGRLGTEGAELARLYGELVKQHPEQVDATLLTRDVLPLLLHDDVGPSYAAQAVLLKAFELRPDLVSPVMGTLVDTFRGVYLPTPTQHVVKAAARKHGWRPTAPRQVDWAAGWLFQSRGGMSNERLMRAHDDFELGFELVRDSLSSRRKAEVLEHLLAAGNDDRVLEFWDHSLGEGNEVYAWLLDGRSAELADQVSARMGHGVGSLPIREKALLTLLHKAGVEGERLAELMAPELERQPCQRVYRRLVDVHRISELEAAPDRLKSLPPGEKTAEVRRLMRLNCLLHQEVPDPPWPARMEAYEQGDTDTWSGPLVGSLSPTDREVLGVVALAEFEKAYREVGSLAKLPVQACADLELLGLLGRDEPLLRLLKDELASGQASPPRVGEQVVARLARADWEKAVVAMEAEPELDRRLEALDGALALAACATV
ncbi:MAG: hypothetical protein AB1758_37840, partial [Candidatus Eremiobacterota bacterium]